MTKVAMKRLLQSEFYHEVYSTVLAWDYYLRKGDEKSADEMMHKWLMAKIALKHITGKTYGFTRNDSSFGLVNEADSSDILFLESTLHGLPMEKNMLSWMVSGRKG